MRNEYLIPLYVEGENKAIFYCDSKKVEVTRESIKKTIDLFLENLQGDDIYKEVGFFGGNFTALEEEKQEELLETVNEYIKDGKIDSIRISTSPNTISKANLKMLKKYKVQTIELSVQTSNDYILGKCKAEYKFNDVKKASKLIRRKGFILGYQIMVGLPESTMLDELNTARDLLKLKPKLVRIYPLVVIANSELANQYENEEFVPLTINQAVERCKELYYFFNKKKINQIHMGYKNADLTMNLKNKQIIAGPYQKNFDQLVEDSIWYDSIVEKIKQFNVKVKEVEVRVNSANATNVVGFTNENLKKLKDFYDVDLKVVKDDDIIPGKFNIKILKTYTDFIEDGRKQKA